MKLLRIIVLAACALMARSLVAQPRPRHTNERPLAGGACRPAVEHVQFPCVSRSTVDMAIMGAAIMAPLSLTIAAGVKPQTGRIL